MLLARGCVAVVALVLGLASSVAFVAADQPSFFGAYAYNPAGPVKMTLVRTTNYGNIDTYNTDIVIESQDHHMAYDFVSKVLYIIDHPESGGTRIHRVPLSYSGWNYEPVLQNTTHFDINNQSIALHFDVNTGLLNGITRDSSNHLFTVIVNPFVGKVTFARPLSWSAYQPDDIVHSSWNPNTQQMLIHGESSEQNVTTIQWRSGVTSDLRTGCIGLEGAWFSPLSVDYVAILTNNSQPQQRCSAKISLSKFGQCEVLDCMPAPSDQPFRGAGITRCSDSCQFLGMFAAQGKLWRINVDGTIQRWQNDAPDTRWVGRGTIFTPASS